VPTSYGYNAYGERTTQRTFRTGDYATNPPPTSGGDLTTWGYHAATGLLEYKEDAAGQRVDYTYTARGQVHVRSWKRLNSQSARVTTTYGYEALSPELTSQTYNDGTPTVGYTYTRAELLQQVTDATGTRTFDYTAALALERENLPAYYGSRVLRPQYDSQHRRAGFQLGTSGTPGDDLTQTLTYAGGTGLLGTLETRQASLSPRTHTYGYVSGTALVDQLSTGSGGSLYALSRTYESGAERDLLASITATYGGGSAKQSGSAFADYADATFYRYDYNTRGELTAATGYLGASVNDLSTPLSGRFFAYDYDGAGNRTSANTTGVPGLAAVHTPNTLNQITSRENPYVGVSGTLDADPTVKVVVQGTLAGKQGGHWSGEVVLDNTSGPAREQVPVKAVKPGSPDVMQAATATVQVAQDPERLTYDYQD